MITLKLKTYTDEEVKKLAELLEYARRDLIPICATNSSCDHCQFNHLCYDLCNSLTYASACYKERTNTSA